MRTLVTAAAILALTAGSVAAMGGCGSYQSAAKTAQLDSAETRESVAQTPAPQSEDAIRLQTAETPNDADDTQQ